MKLEIKWGEETSNEKGQGNLVITSWDKKGYKNYYVFAILIFCIWIYEDLHAYLLASVPKN